MTPDAQRLALLELELSRDAALAKLAVYEGRTNYLCECGGTKRDKAIREEALREAAEFKSHAGDCTVYAALFNGSPTDGICTCGFGWQHVRKGDWSFMYSQERLSLISTKENP